MPRNRNSLKIKLKKYINIYGKDVLQTDGDSLICRVCSIKLNSDRKSQIDQHLLTKTHQLNVNSNSARQNQLPNMLEDNIDNDYARNLTEAFVAADIPLYKLNNPKLVTFLEKYTKRKTPSERTCRRHIESLYQSTLEQIRKEIGNSPIYVEIDETTDSEGMGNLTY